MPTTYSVADPDVLDLLARARNTWHPRLTEAGVRVGVLMAANEAGPAVKHGGYAAFATVKPVSLKDRVSKGYDAELVIDAREWESMEDAHRIALLDHELSHLDLIPLPLAELNQARQHDADAPWWKLDDLGRPRLKSVPADWNTGDAFKAVIARHGEYAVEFENLRRSWARAAAARQESETQRASA